MKIRALLAAALLTLAACASSTTAPEPRSIRADEIAPRPPADTTNRGGGSMGNGN